MMYDYLIVGAGLYGAVVANILHRGGKKVVVIDRRNHVAGNAYTYKEDNIVVHKYGPHIFHTNNFEVFSFIKKFGSCHIFYNQPKAKYKDKMYSLPFNMNTFNELFGTTTPEEAKKVIEEEKTRHHIDKPKNLEEQAISLVGETVYKTLVKEYTEKQWGKDCKELDPSIIKRLPVRYTYDNNYFNDVIQMIPDDGYTSIVEKMLDGIEVRLNLDYKDFKDEAKVVVYTGAIDELFDYKYGKLDYRYLRFETKKLDTDNFQGNAVVNYTSKDVDYTRITEHKWFDKDRKSNKTIISYEYSTNDENYERCYPINNERNTVLYQMYLNELKTTNIKVGGRLGLYMYLNMDQVIERAIAFANGELYE